MSKFLNRSLENMDVHIKRSSSYKQYHTPGKPVLSLATSEHARRISREQSKKEDDWVDNSDEDTPSAEGLFVYQRRGSFGSSVINNKIKKGKQSPKGKIPISKLISESTYRGRSVSSDVYNEKF